MTELPVVRPPRLRPGDTIGLVTPGRSALFPMRLDRGIAELRRMGFAVRLGEHALLPDQTERQRVADLHAMFMDPEVRAIFLTLAGEAATMTRLLDLLDFDLIRAHPKILVGQSAATTLIMGIHQRTGLVTFHGPCVVQHFGNIDGTDAVTEQNLLAVLSGEAVKYAPAPSYTDEYRDWDYEDERRAFLPGTPWRALKPGRAKGRLLGGSLRGVVRNLASPFALDYRGAICFWDLPFDPRVLPDMTEVRGLLSRLEEHGVFASAAGMLVGKPYLYNGRDATLPQFDNVLKAAFEPHELPVVAGVDCGHTVPMLTLPLGVLAEIEAPGRQFRLIEPAVT